MPTLEPYQNDFVNRLYGMPVFAGWDLGVKYVANPATPTVTREVYSDSTATYYRALTGVGTSATAATYALSNLAVTMNNVAQTYTDLSNAIWRQLNTQLNAATTAINTWTYHPALVQQYGDATYAPITMVTPAQAAKQVAAAKRATARARKLIREHLTAEQLESLAAQNYFELLSSSGRRYRIKRGHSRNVYRLDAQGREVERLCAYATTPGMPDEDHMLIQKLHLETDENGYRKVANKSRLYLPAQAAA